MNFIKYASISRREMIPTFFNLGVNMKLRSLFLVCLFTLCQTTFAAMPPKPAKCPTASDLQSAIFFFAQKPDDAPGYIAMTMGNFNTQDQWAVMMAFLQTDDILGAILEANTVKSNISGNPRPIPVEDQNVWVCPYGVSGTSYQVLAVTPLSMGGMKANANSLMNRV
jgi:hypothetical protein